MGKVIVRGEEARQQALEIVKNGGTVEDAAEQTGFGWDYVRQLCNQNGIEYTRRKTEAKERKEERYNRIVALHSKGYTPKEITQELSINDTTIRKVLKDNGLKPNRKSNIIFDREAMRAYKAEGHTNKEVAKKFGCTKEHAHIVCKGIAPQVAEVRGPQISEEYAIRKINERTPNFEYVGNYTGSDGFADIKCKVCGTVQRKSFVSIRNGYATCMVCQQKEIDARREEKKEQRQKDVKRNRQLKKYRTVLKQNTIQTEMKQCPICGDMFIGSTNKKYCSQRCRDASHWHAKEAYRYLFPLEEVYKRDNGICYLCGGQCDWNDYKVKDGVTIYGNNYPSRDHVVPKSRGGANTWENIRLAHRICNTLKRDRAPVA